MEKIRQQQLQVIAQLLVHNNLVKKAEILEYQEKAELTNQTLLEYLVTIHQFPPGILATLISQHFGIPFLDLECINFNLAPKLINENLIRRYHLAPLFIRGGQLYVAMDDPGCTTALKEIQFHTGLHTTAIVVETHKLRCFIEQIINQRVAQRVTNYTEKKENPVINKTVPAYLSNEDASIVKLVNEILFDAIKRKVSDIHFEPYEKSYRIRYRQDGILLEAAAPALDLASRITARIKIMSNLDISERRLPQDGRFQLKLSDKDSIDCRVNSCPTISGEKIVIRLLNSDSPNLGIEELGFNSQQEKLFLTALEKPQGMILITGPTGSGKTISLYAALSKLNTQERNISSVEDPVEIKMPGINQVNINPKTGLTFAKTLRSFLRQDPDVLMIGEIRDLETAEIAIKAAQTGHLVLSTLHTNSATETLTRLMNMGIAPYNIASSISLLISQRLVRRLCDHCKRLQEGNLNHNPVEPQSIKCYQACGCSQCTYGYNGRIGLFEVMPMSKTIANLILSGGNSLDIFNQAQIEGMQTLYRSGLEKVNQGITTLEEINRVTIN
ncbi:MULTISPECIES: type IV-A pilus assembly ATPase PilB [unclassified Legionella]|uniref:type IV-A pilus assembly ATPase PilB n=1 Tax=unclassified Legionella TaxID=2622702 RepID=UPI001055FA72|nr:MULTISPECIES: type IV-A pilus assembly ATPase PilB [unclassified Legionella]MDI9818230.1 type IV-A pilus assembly ATPase PilB [Legionella sp. PL877]